MNYAPSFFHKQQYHTVCSSEYRYQTLSLINLLTCMARNISQNNFRVEMKNVQPILDEEKRNNED